MSNFSPDVVDETELLARFVFVPIHLKKVGAAVKPSFFDQIHTSGCSVQRDALAADKEISTFVSNFLNGDVRRAWVGVITGQCKSIRAIRMEAGQERALCVYDTAEQSNPAHGEVFCSGDVSDDADRLELRHDLWSAFNNGAMIPSKLYRAGTIWGSLTPTLQTRP